MELVTNWWTLLHFARNCAKAEQKYGKDSYEYKIACREHDTYRDMCIKADRMIIPQVKD